MAAPGWYNDASDPTIARWHDGNGWTGHTMRKADWKGPGTPPPPAPLSPAFSAPPPAPAEKKQNSAQVGCGLMILVVIVLVIVGMVAGGDEDKDGRGGGDASDLEYGAFDVCQQFVKQELKAPGTAKFRNFFEDDGEVTVTHTGDEYTVVSSVDAENSFGASLRSNFRCVVTHVSGDTWHKVSVTLG